MKHSILNLDALYTVSKEYCGHPTIMCVARFCGEFIGAYKTVKEAEEACKQHNQNRIGD